MTHTPRAPVDTVRVLPLDCAEMRAACQARGPTFAGWRSYWESLDPVERDPLSYPTWVAGHLQGQLSSDTADATLVVVALAGGEVRSLLPVTVERPGALKHATGFDGKSWALARSDYCGAMRALFATSVAGKRLRSLYLESVDSTNALLDTDWPSVATPVWFRSLIDLSEGYEAMLARLTSSNRSGVRRLGKKISRKHAVELESVVQRDDLAQGFERFLRIDERSWKKDRGNTLRNDPRQRESLRASLAHMAREGRAVVHILRADGEDIAAQLGVVIDRQLLVIKTSYNADWARFGAGKLLLDMSMRDWCPQNGIVGLNLVTGLSWHLQWSPRQVGTSALWLLARGPRGGYARLRDVPPRENAKAVVRGNGLEAPIRRLLRRA